MLILRLRDSTVFHKSPAVANYFAQNLNPGDFSPDGWRDLNRVVDSEASENTDCQEQSQGRHIIAERMPSARPESRSWHSAPTPITAQWRLPAEPTPRPVVCVILASGEVVTTTPRWPTRGRRMVRDSDWSFGVGVPRLVDIGGLITGCILADFAIKSGRRCYLYRTGPLETEKEKEED